MHPRPWEWEAQSLVRRLAEIFQAGDLIIVRESRAGGPAGVAHVRFVEGDGALVAHLMVIAVRREDRWAGANGFEPIGIPNGAYQDWILLPD